LASARGIELTLDIADEIPTITADEEKLHRVFENLVKNAVEAIDQGPGRVRLRAAPVRSDQVRISVEDTGPGIPQELEVFRLFETTKPHGSGLGLPIVRQIVLAHGGGIGFAAVEPHGTAFNIELPCGGPAG
jgi:signal transduction histidine kinase